MVTVNEIQEKSSSSALRTGKRLGYLGGNEGGGGFGDEAQL